MNWLKSRLMQPPRKWVAHVEHAAGGLDEEGGGEVFQGLIDAAPCSAQPVRLAVSEGHHHIADDCAGWQLRFHNFVHRANGHELIAHFAHCPLLDLWRQVMPAGEPRNAARLMCVEYPSRSQRCKCAPNGRPASTKTACQSGGRAKSCPAWNGRVKRGKARHMGSAGGTALATAQSGGGSTSGRARAVCAMLRTAATSSADNSRSAAKCAHPAWPRGLMSAARKSYCSGRSWHPGQRARRSTSWQSSSSTERVRCRNAHTRACPSRHLQ